MHKCQERPDRGAKETQINLSANEGRDVALLPHKKAQDGIVLPKHSKLGSPSSCRNARNLASPNNPTCKHDLGQALGARAIVSKAEEPVSTAAA